MCPLVTRREETVEKRLDLFLLPALKHQPPAASRGVKNQNRQKTEAAHVHVETFVWMATEVRTSVTAGKTLRHLKQRWLEWHAPEDTPCLGAPPPPHTRTHQHGKGSYFSTVPHRKVSCSTDTSIFFHTGQLLSTDRSTAVHRYAWCSLHIGQLFSRQVNCCSHTGQLFSTVRSVTFVDGPTVVYKHINCFPWTDLCSQTGWLFSQIGKMHR